MMLQQARLPLRNLLLAQRGSADEVRVTAASEGRADAQDIAEKAP
jgi:hypothetical protein